MRSQLENLDFWSLLIWLALVSLGLLAIYSATQGSAHQYLEGSVKNNFDRQLVWMVIALVCMVVALLIRVDIYMDLAFIAYGACILLLIAALVFGREVGGARSWVYIGSYGFQSSELAKVGTILAVARLLATSRRKRAGTFKLIAVGLLLLPAILVVMQNDTGTALVFVGLIPVVLFWAGSAPILVILLITPAIACYLAVISIPFAIGFSALLTLVLFGLHQTSRSASASIFERMPRGHVAAAGGLLSGGTVATVYFALANVLQPHHVARLNAFANPEAPEFQSGVGFHLMQSKAAIGSGGLFGQGLMHGTQTQGAFIPEQSTDFIFSVIGEELGFAGAILVVALFGILLMRMVMMADQVYHPFGSVLAASAAGLLLIQVYINIGMVLGLLPVIGIPLPLVSYGGSALLANTLMLAIVFNLHMRRREFSF